MAVSEMNFISMIGNMKNIDEIVNICGESGVFQPDNVFTFYSDTEGFTAISEENPYSEPFQVLGNAINDCGGKLFDVDISKFYVSRSKIERYVGYFADSVTKRVDEKRLIYQEISEIKEEIKILKNFYGLDRSLEEILSCEYIKPRFGKIPIAGYRQMDKLTEQNAKKGIDILFFPFKCDGEYQWGIYFADLDHKEEIDRIFSSIYFDEVKIKSCPRTPYEQAEFLMSRSRELYKRIEEIEKELWKFWDSQKNQCMKFYLKLRQLSAYFEIKAYAAKYHNNFILVGWVPKEDIKNFEKKISKVKSIEYTTEEGKNILNHLPPVKLRNNKIFRPFEFFVDTYGMPSYNEMDPTMFVAITYTVLFGIMFADLGQGLVVSLVGLVMWKFRNMKLGRALIPCGISSAIFGTIFGSVFGFEHILDPFYKNVFGLSEKPIEVMDSSVTNYIIYAAVGIGVLLLILSLLLGMYSSLKRKNLGEALFSPNGFCGFVFYSSTVFALVDMTVLHTGIISGVFVGIFMGLPLLLLLFSEMLIKLANGRSDWKPESWGDYLSQSFFELFETVLSYMSNTMSFLRVGAFVLVHAGMMMVVFTLADMVGAGIGYAIVMILGNIIVIALESLLAGVQVLRLEFYEMFSKFFEGQGRPYSPIKVSESLQNIQ